MLILQYNCSIVFERTPDAIPEVALIAASKKIFLRSLSNFKIYYYICIVI
nr:MAG TPA: hypothetical protein [Caudoviricetes sp.]